MGEGRFSADAPNVAAVLAFAAAMLAFGWTGFLAGDDAQYAAAAQEWLESHVAGRGTAALRPTVVLPIALSFSMLGVRELPLVLPTVGYFLGLLVVTYAAMSAAIDRATGLAAALLLASTPLFALNATVASVDIAELFFVASSLWLCHGAEDSEWRRPRLIGAGLAAGLALATRETSLLLLAYYGFLAVLGEPDRRRSYLLVVGTAAAVLAAELAYLGMLTGNPLHRLMTDWTKQQVLPRTPTGNVEVNRWVDPILALLVNQEFALLFFIAIPVGLRMSFGRGAGWRARRAVRFVAAFGALWFLGIGYCPWLRSLPRYFSVTAYAAVIAVAAWLGMARSAGRRAVAALLLASNLLAIYVDNRNPLYGSRCLVAFAARAGETVYTDPATAERARFLLNASHLSERVIGALPPPGALFLYDPNETAGKGGPDTATAEWTVVERFDPGRKLSGRVAEWLGVDALLAAGVARKLDRPNSTVTVYRTPR